MLDDEPKQEGAKDTTNRQDGYSIVSNIMSFLVTLIVSLILGYGMFAWWGMIFIIAGGILIVAKSSRKMQGVAVSALLAIAVLLTIIGIWPILEAIAPSYFSPSFQSTTDPNSQNPQ